MASKKLGKEPILLEEKDLDFYYEVLRGDRIKKYKTFRKEKLFKIKRIKNKGDL